MTARGVVVVVRAEERGQFVLQFVAAPFFKFGEKIRRPVGAIFVGILILRARFRAGIMVKSAAEPFQIIRHGVGVQRIEHPAFAAGRGAFDFLAGRLLRNGINFPGFGRPGCTGSRPVARRGKEDFAVGGNGAGQVKRFATGRNGDECLDCVAVKFLPEPFTDAEIESFHNHTGVRICIADVRPAKTPARARGHVHAHAEAFGLGDRPTHHLHPFWRKVADIIRFKTARTVNRDDMDPAKSGIVVTGQLPGQIGFVHRAAHPPPIDPRACL